MASSEYYMQPRYYEDRDIILKLDNSSSKSPSSNLEGLGGGITTYRSINITSTIGDGPYKLQVTEDTDYYRIDNLTILGQGTIGLEFKAIGNSGICIKLNQSSGKDFISLDIGKSRACILMRKGNKKFNLAETADPKALLNTKRDQLYWLSLDRKNCFLRYGIGPMQSLLTVLYCDFKELLTKEIEEQLTKETEEQKEDLLQKKRIEIIEKRIEEWIKKFSFVTVRGLVVKQENSSASLVISSKLNFWSLPVTVDLPPIIIKREDMTLEKLELGEVTVIDNLPKECQKLYWNIAGNNVSLNTPDFPDFADAIEHSIRDNKGICYKKLEEKAKVEGKDLKETYLRVTLGQDQGNSPGVPFVLEIWPSGHYSPIHKHAECFAVIKVLYNEIVTLYFAGLELEEQKWYKRADLKQSEFTWISNEFYQTHQLWNPTSKMCATIQCYQYGDNNEVHYENFDYIDSQSIKIKQFKPKSDWTFAKFKNLIKEEWKYPFNNEMPSRRKDPYHVIKAKL